MLVMNCENKEMGIGLRLDQRQLLKDFLPTDNFTYIAVEENRVFFISNKGATKAYDFSEGRTIMQNHNMDLSELNFAVHYDHEQRN